MIPVKKDWKKQLNADKAKALRYAAAAIRWIILGVIIGVICGAAGSVFHHAIEIGQELFAEHDWLVYLLPVSGLAIAGIYSALKLIPDPGTNAILKASASGEPVSPQMSLAIFAATVLTQLTGGSGGREGAALQLGGSIAGFLGLKMKLSRTTRRTVILCGMSAVFSALFGTPITAALFCLEVVRVGTMPYPALVPCLISSLVANNVSMFFGMHPTKIALANVPAATSLLLVQVAVLSILCSLVAILFCEVQHLGGGLFKKIPNVYLRVLVGSAILIGMTLLVGSHRYNGAGMGAVVLAVEKAEALPQDFILKILFTAITLGCGFKGGEIVPAFFTGATFGCVVGPLLGLDPGLAAAVGMVTVFCGVVNSPLASIVLAVEVFGGEVLSIAALPIALCYLLSGKASLYKNQVILDSKLQLTEIFTD